MNEENTKDTLEEATVVTDEVITPDEVLPPEALQVLKNSKLTPDTSSRLKLMFKERFSKIEKYAAMAYDINVTDISQKPEMKLSASLRSNIRTERTGADKDRKAEGEDARLFVGAVNGMFNVLKAIALPAEAHLEKQEKFAERYEAEQKDQLRKAREIALEPYSEVITSEGMDLAAMTDEGFDNLVNGAKLQIEAKQKEDEEAERLRIAEEKRIEAERIEAERKREEERQKEIDDANERARVAEVKRVEEARIAEEARVEAERIAEVERKEREVADKKAEAEKVKADAETKRLKKVADDATAETARLKKIADDAKLASDNLKAEKLAEEKKIASAPDKDKLLAFAGRLRDANMPSMATDGGKKVISNISNQFKAMADWIEEAVKKQM